MKKLITIAFVLILMLAGCTGEISESNAKDADINTVAIATIDIHLYSKERKSDAGEDYTTFGRSIRSEGRNTIIEIDVSKTPEQIADTLLHEVAHELYNDEKHLLLGKNLASHTLFTHWDKDNPEEKIAFWYARFVLYNEETKKDNPNEWNIIKQFIKEKYE